MSHLKGWLITCPNPKCGHKAVADDFDPSLADEMECPKCGENFIFEWPEDEDGGEE